MPLIGFVVFKSVISNSPKTSINSPSKVVLTLLDVGQGLSVWVQQGEHNMLYDLGNRYYSGFNLVDAVILPEMLGQGVNQLEVLVISHWDMDHSGGLNALLQQQLVKRLILPSEHKPKREQAMVVSAADVSRCTSTRWKALWEDANTPLMWRQIALADYGLTGNNASCVILLKLFGRQVLIVGDIEAKAETILVDLSEKLGAMSLVSDVLIAPHHGSKTSSSKEFLNHVMPAYVLISAGKNNSYGHPHKNITSTYWRHGSHWYNTGRHGQIQAIFEADGSYQVMPYLP